MMASIYLFIICLFYLSFFIHLFFYYLYIFFSFIFFPLFIFTVTIFLFTVLFHHLIINTCADHITYIFIYICVPYVYVGCVKIVQKMKCKFSMVFLYVSSNLPYCIAYSVNSNYQINAPTLFLDKTIIFQQILIFSINLMFVFYAQHNFLVFLFQYTDCHEK